ncbi:MAG TPA: MarR family transcriptional regulator [Bryobacteraceae bacterium]|nr:MarR family transcriptional regulator [Bryobacteraceae bacterium]
MSRRVTPGADLTSADYQALGEFRYQVRRFQHFSENAARAQGLEPQQHQMLLSIRASDTPGGPTVRMLAEHMLIQHHSAVGLIDRLSARGLVERVRGEEDRRQVQVRMLPEGEARLQRLSDTHREELRRSGPLLVAALSRLLQRYPA